MILSEYYPRACRKFPLVSWLTTGKSFNTVIFLFFNSQLCGILKKYLPPGSATVVSTHDHKPLGNVRATFSALRSGFLK
jgi:hypothetical protein